MSAQILEFRRHVSLRGWTVTFGAHTDFASFERDIDGTGGGLWFDGKELVDQDGTFQLPLAVAVILMKAGYSVAPEYVTDDQDAIKRFEPRIGKLCREGVDKFYTFDKAGDMFEADTAYDVLVELCKVV